MRQFRFSRHTLSSFVIFVFLSGALVVPFLPAPSHTGDIGTGRVSMDSVPRFGIPRNTPSTSGSNTYYVGASSNGAAALPNDGVQCTLQVIPLSSAVSGSLSFWCADDTSSGMWGQVGYYFFDGTTPTAFWQIWNLNTYTEVATGTTSISTGTHTFSMNLQSGTIWAYSLDGNVFGTYDMAATSSVDVGGYPVYALSEEGYTSGAFSFPQTLFSTAMNVDVLGVWTPVLTATSYGNSWGVQGNLQSSLLQPDSISVGGTLSVISSGTTLWNGLSVSSTSSSSSTTLSSTSTYTSTSSSTSTTTSSTVTLSQITIQLSAGPYFTGTPLKLSGYTYGTNGLVLPLQTIYLWINGAGQGPVTSNSIGQWSFSYTPRSSGTYVASATLNPDGSGLASNQLSWQVKHKHFL